ncbi:Gfo/Idh/MocA family oxidoreductase [Pelagibacteraceae bacterium]|nr:Gfo/Idh/MocA family oxidoreductase [Pelagibacteraceae bacterium]
MNWGIIGLGHMAKKFANSTKELESGNLLGVSSHSIFKLLKFSYKYKINFKYLFNDYQKILDCKDIDSIYIGTLNSSHFDLIIACINAKKNVLCEKPFVLSLNQAKEIKEKLKTSNIFFLEGIAYRSHPQTRHLIKLLKEKHIGKIIKIKSTFGFKADNLRKKGRLLNKKLGGGSIFDLGCYPVSMSNLIANIYNEIEIVPTVSKVTGKMHKSGVDLNGKANLSYSNGIISEIEVSIIENLVNSTEILGSDGMIKILEPWLPNKDSVIEIHKNKNIKKLNTFSDLSIFASQINLFNNSIKNKKIKDNYPAMSIDNSINCIKTMIEWKESIL